jgi:LysM repeat protein
LAIATKNNIDLSKLLEYNDLTKDGILPKSQLIFLQKKSTEGDKQFYITQQNETLYDVAQKNGIQLASLLVYNEMRPGTKIYPGTRLYLRLLKKPAPAKTTLEIQGDKQYITVQPKEGLYSIAKKYGISVGQIKEWNNLDSNQLHIGQQLVIYK